MAKRSRDYQHFSKRKARPIRRPLLEDVQAKLLFHDARSNGNERDGGVSLAPRKKAN
jgi:hypothetical protein